jgi:hypothetical protein
MKKLIYLFLIAVVAINTASAQEEILSAKLKKEEMPIEVLTAITRDFKDGVSITEYRALPIEVLEEGWIVDYNPLHKNLKSSYDTYEVDLSGKNISGHAVYDAEGNLIYLVENMKDAILPHFIQKNIGTNFPGWAVYGDHEIVSMGKDSRQKIYYRITLAKGKEKKRVVYDGNGNLIKVNREHKMGHTLFQDKEVGDKK